MGGMAAIEIPDDAYQVAVMEARLAGIGVADWMVIAVNRAAHDADRELPMDDSGFDSPLTIPVQTASGV